MLDRELQLHFATSNSHKVEEAKELLPAFEIIQFETDLIEIKSEHLEDIAVRSLESLPESVPCPVFVEDSGIFIHHLDGFPGPISGYTHQKLGNGRILSLLTGADDWSAHFESVIALQIPEGDIVSFTGRVDGRIAQEEAGSHGFDYDSIFVPKGEQRTLAEMTTSEKNDYSHRGIALERMRRYLVGTERSP